MTPFRDRFAINGINEITLHADHCDNVCGIKKRLAEAGKEVDRGKFKGSLDKNGNILQLFPIDFQKLITTFPLLSLNEGEELSAAVKNKVERTQMNILKKWVSQIENCVLLSLFSILNNPVQIWHVEVQQLLKGWK